MAGDVDQQGSQAGGRTERRVRLALRQRGAADPVKALIETPVATRVAKSARRDPRSSRASQLGRIAALCLAPAAVFLLILIAYPLSRVIWSAFHYVNLTNPTVAGFAGLDNFTSVIEDEHFWPSLWHTGVWTVSRSPANTSSASPLRSRSPSRSGRAASFAPSSSFPG
jgi:hypothetical protein